MKFDSKHITKLLWTTFVVMTMIAFLEAGCAKQSTPDPLAGWNLCSDQDPAKLGKAIQADYQDYIQKLPPEEKKFAYYAHSFENGAGQHAVQIEIPLNGTWWEHILIYSTNSNRIKTIKYSKGSYQS